MDPVLDGGEQRNKQSRRLVVQGEGARSIGWDLSFILGWAGAVRWQSRVGGASKHQGSQVQTKQQTTCNRKQRQDNTYGQGTHTFTMYIKIEKTPIKKYIIQSSTFGRQQLVRLEKNFRILLSSFLMPPDESVAAAGTSVAAGGTSVAAAGTSGCSGGVCGRSGDVCGRRGDVCGCSGGVCGRSGDVCGRRGDVCGCSGDVWLQRGCLWPQRGRLQCRQNTRTFHWWPL